MLSQLVKTSDANGNLPSPILTSNKTIIAEDSITFPEAWFRKRTVISWEKVQKIIDSRGTLQVWFTDSNGLVKAKNLGICNKKDRETVLEHWETILAEEIKGTGHLSGTLKYYPDKSTVEKLFICLALGLLAALFLSRGISIIDTCRNVFSQHETEFIFLYLWIAWILFLGVALYSSILGITAIKILLNSSKWHNWVISKDGLQRKNRYEQWEKLSFKEGDKITSGEIVINGNKVPWQRFTRNRIIPHILAIVAKREGINVACGKGIGLRESLRLFFLWPLLTLLLVFLPLLLWGAPQTMELNIREYVFVAVFGTSLMGMLMLTVYFLTNRAYKKNFHEFIRKTEIIRHKLCW